MNTRILTRISPSLLWRLPFNLVFSTLVLILLLVSSINGQVPSARAKSEPDRKLDDGSATALVAESRQRLLAASQTYRQSLEKLLVLQSQDTDRARTQLERSQKLLENGLIPRRQTETAEQELLGSISRQSETARQLELLDNLVAEVHAAELAISSNLSAGGSTGGLLSGPLVRFVGTSRWSMADVTKIDAFYRLKFGRPLPISALGQTITHDQLGFDHHEAVDVAVHPDTSEGQELILFLQSQGLSFIAIRQAISGSATGAHIHIGPPSRRAGPVR